MVVNWFDDNKNIRRSFIQSKSTTLPVTKRLLWPIAINLCVVLQWDYYLPRDPEQTTITALIMLLRFSCNRQEYKDIHQQQWNHRRRKTNVGVNTGNTRAHSMFLNMSHTHALSDDLFNKNIVCVNFRHVQEPDGITRATLVYDLKQETVRSVLCVGLKPNRGHREWVWLNDCNSHTVYPIKQGPGNSTGNSQCSLLVLNRSLKQLLIWKSIKQTVKSSEATTLM